jgi:hypothetical protein
MVQPKKTLKDYAYYYRDKLGLSVIPLYSYTPSVRKMYRFDWSPYKTRYATDVEIDEWFGNNKSIDERRKRKRPYNIGIVMGNISKVIGIDVDGSLAVKRIMKDKRSEMSTDLKTLLDTTMINTSGSHKGIHIIFKRDESSIKEIVSQLPIWYASMDEMAAIGESRSEIRIMCNESYLVAPPSIHPNGKRYEWNGKAPQVITRQQLVEFISVFGYDLFKRISIDNDVLRHKESI